MSKVEIEIANDRIVPVTAVATTVANGLMSSTDKTKLDGLSGSSGDMLKATYDTTNNGIVDNAEKVNGLTVETAVPTGALFTDTVYTHPTADGSLHVPATSTTNNGKVLTAGATAGSISWQTVPLGVTDHTLLTNIGTNTHNQIDTALTRLANTLGTNTGDQDLSTYTNQGNTFNGVNQLVKLDATGKLPAIDGSQLTGITTSGGTVTSVTAGNGMAQSGTSTINPTLDIVSHAGSAGTIGTINIGVDAIGVNLGTTSTTACSGADTRLSDARTPTAHTHGNITNTGYLGVTSSIPLITGTAGIIQAGSFATTAGSFAEGNHVHGDITSLGSVVTTPVTIENADTLLIADNSAANVIKRGVAFGTDTATFLSNAGTWGTPAGSSPLLYTYAASSVASVAITGLSISSGRGVRLYIREGGSGGGVTVSFGSSGAYYIGRKTVGTTTTFTATSASAAAVPLGPFTATNIAQYCVDIYVNHSITMLTSRAMSYDGANAANTAMVITTASASDVATITSITVANLGTSYTNTITLSKGAGAW